MYENITPSENHALNLLRDRMSYFSHGTPEYELARQAFASLCALIRARERSDQETRSRIDARKEEGAFFDKADYDYSIALYK